MKRKSLKSTRALKNAAGANVTISLAKSLAMPLALASVVLAGCGGASGPSASNPNEDGAEQSFGSVVTRGLATGQPVVTNSAHVTVTGLRGAFTMIKANDLQPAEGEGTIAVSRPANGGVFLMDSDGSNYRNVSSVAGQWVNWDPTGLRLMIRTPIGTAWKLATIPSEGGAAKALIDGMSAKFSPDGSRIAFMREGDYFNLYLAKADGTSVTNIRNTFGVGIRSYEWVDNEWLYFNMFEDGGTGEVYKVRFDGTGYNQVSYTASDVISFAVSPDRRTIAYSDNSSPGIKIASLNFGVSSIVALTHFVERDQLTWLPDGKTLAFASYGGIYCVGTEDGSQPRSISGVEQGYASMIAAQPFVSERKIVGSGTPMLTASGFLMSQTGSKLNSLVTFRAQTPGTVELTPQSQQNNSGPNLIYTVEADDLRQLQYTIGTNLKPVAVATVGANGAIVSIDSVTGAVTMVATYVGTRSKRPEVRTTGGTQSASGTFLAVYDAQGMNIAPQGASEIQFPFVK